MSRYTGYKPDNASSGLKHWGIGPRKAVAPVKHQGKCGSCWTFSTPKCFESVWSIATGNLLTLSEQQLVDCITVDSACTTEGTCKVSNCNVDLAQGSVTGYTGEALMSSVVQQHVPIAIEAGRSFTTARHGIGFEASSSPLHSRRDCWRYTRR